MPYKTLPDHPSLEHLKNQARDLQRALEARELQAFQRVREFHPRLQKASDDQIREASLSLSDIQFVIAREYCFPSWAKLKASVIDGSMPDPKVPFIDRIEDAAFREAVNLLDAGDTVALSTHLRSHPQVVRQRVFFSIDDYFGRPSLLEFAAENPIRRGVLPANIVETEKVVLDAGAKDDHEAVDRALELVASGSVSRECGVQVALINLLCDYRANPDAAMMAALGHGEFEAVDTLLRRGARIDLPVAAATGRTGDAAKLLATTESENRHRALAYASQFGHVEIVRLLLDAGEDPNRFNPKGCHSHSTPLHQAAFAGNLDVVRLLVERGADTTVKDILFSGTPLGWAEHGHRTVVAAFLRAEVA